MRTETKGRVSSKQTVNVSHFYKYTVVKITIRGGECFGGMLVYLRRL